MEEQKQLANKLSSLQGNPYRADGKLKAISTLNREIKSLENEQMGGSCGCGSKSQASLGPIQMGGDYKNLPTSALDKAAIWREEVKKVQTQYGIKSYKEAMKKASDLRKEKDDQYKTMRQRYVEHLDSIRQDKTAAYSPYGSKNKRPLSLEAAQRILLQYYRQRADQYEKGPLTAMRKKISSCHKNPKRTLTPCPPGVKSKQQALQISPECVGSWKYRPGKNAKGPTGPGYYDMDGLDNLCGPENAQARKESQLYNMHFMHKKSKQKGGGNDYIKNPLTGRDIKRGGETHKKLIADGIL